MPSYMIEEGSGEMKILSVCVAASELEPPVLLLLFWPKQQREDVGGEGGQKEQGCMVDRLGA